jgi:hypothetical protein
VHFLQLRRLNHPDVDARAEHTQSGAERLPIGARLVGEQNAEGSCRLHHPPDLRGLTEGSVLEA